jgi:hypothetical protein
MVSVADEISPIEDCKRNMYSEAVNQKGGEEIGRIKLKSPVISSLHLTALR